MRKCVKRAWYRHCWDPKDRPVWQTIEHTRFQIHFSPSLSLILIRWRTHASLSGNMQLSRVHIIIDMHTHTHELDCYEGSAMPCWQTQMNMMASVRWETPRERGRKKVRQKGRQMKGKKWDGDAKELRTPKRIKPVCANWLSLFYMIPAGVCIQTTYFPTFKLTVLKPSIFSIDIFCFENV